MNNKKFLKRIKLLQIDHQPQGWPAIQMKDITRLLNIIENLQAEVDYNKNYNGWDNK